MRTRFSGALVLALGAAMTAHASPSAAAPKKQQQQQCIAAAESGQQLRSAGKLRDARKAFGPCTASSCSAVIRRDCGRWIEEIDTATPTFTVRMQDEHGADVPDGRILVDGEILPNAGDGHATSIDPGMHRFVWERDGGNIVQEQVIREGEHNRLIVLQAVLVGPPAPAASEPAPPPSSRSPLPWIVGTAGVVLMAGGGVFWGVGLHDRASLSSTCAGAHACAPSDVDASRTKLLVGDVLVGIGVVALAGAVYLFLRQSGSASTASASSASR